MLKKLKIIIRLDHFVKNKFFPCYANGLGYLSKKMKKNVLAKLGCFVNKEKNCGFIKTV